jgi:hypothetical protein
MEQTLGTPLRRPGGEAEGRQRGSCARVAVGYLGAERTPTIAHPNHLFVWVGKKFQKDAEEVLCSHGVKSK